MSGHEQPCSSQFQQCLAVLLALCFCPSLGACVSGLVVPVLVFGVGFVWLSGVWLDGLSALGRF